MLEDIFNVLTHQNINDLTMLEETWQPLNINVSHFTILNQRSKQPKCHDFICMVEQSTYYEVHALNIVYVNLKMKNLPT